MNAAAPHTCRWTCWWTRGLIVCAVMLGTILVPLVAQASTWIVVRRVRLYDEPRSSSPHLRTLEKGERLTSISSTSGSEVVGYYRRVRTDQGEVGWSYAPYLAEVEEPMPAPVVPTSGVPPNVAGLATGLDAAGQRLLGYIARQMEGCPSEPDCPTEYLDDCPPCGCGEPWSEKAAQCIMKRRLPWQDEDRETWLATTRPIRLSHEQFDALQRATKSPDKSGKVELTLQDRLKTLRGLTIVADGGTVTLNEGDYVELVGFVAQDRKLDWGGAESVNCKLAGANLDDPAQPHADIHVPIVPGPNGTQCESIVVEPIPQYRPEPGVWWPSDFAKLKAEKTQIIVRGPLFYDNEHKVRDCARKDAPDLGSQPQRISLWEIHPVVEVLRCKHGSGCDPDEPSEWVPVR